MESSPLVAIRELGWERLETVCSLRTSTAIELATAIDIGNSIYYFRNLYLYFLERLNPFRHCGPGLGGSLSFLLSLFLFIGSIQSFINIFKVSWSVILFYWFINLKDIIRETSKKCNFIPLEIYIYYFIIFIFSETILFFTIFIFIYYFILSSYYLWIESIFIPDPCELTYGTTLLLSNAGISLNSIYINRDCLGIFYWNNFINLFLLFYFISIQINEFRYLGFYINDSEISYIYIFLTGLHFIHILYGIIILGINSNYREKREKRNISLNIYFIIQIYYWHFIEVIWLYIYIILYYFYNLYFKKISQINKWKEIS